MIRKAYIVAVLVVGLAALTAGTSPAVRGFVSSTQTFRQYFHELQASSRSLSTLERFVLSFVLANTHASACPATPERTT